MERRIWNLTLIARPPLSSNSQPKNPADLPAFRRWQAVLRWMRKGKTEEEAVALCPPTGVCKCGAKCGKRARTCAECRRLQMVEKSRKMREEGKHLVEGECRICGTAFIGTRSRKNCDAHEMQRPGGYTIKVPKEKKANGRPRNVSQQAPPVKFYENPLPDTWGRQLPEHLKLQPTPKPVDMSSPEVLEFLAKKAAARPKVSHTD